MHLPMLRLRKDSDDPTLNDRQIHSCTSNSNHDYISVMFPAIR